MRKLAWVLVVLLFASSAGFYVRYSAISDAFAKPDSVKTAQLGAFYRHLRSEAGFSLFLSLASAALGALTLVLLATTRRSSRASRRGRRREACPHCEEPVRGIGIVCRSCGFRFGPKPT